MPESDDEVSRQIRLTREVLEAKMDGLSRSIDQTRLSFDTYVQVHDLKYEHLLARVNHLEVSMVSRTELSGYQRFVMGALITGLLALLGVMVDLVLHFSATPP